MGGHQTPAAASGVEPASIQQRVACGSDAELLVRRRPPGGVDLPAGQREHMLLLSSGSPVDERAIRSVLHTKSSRHEWSDCPQGHVTFVPAGFPFKWDWSYQSDSVHLTLPTRFMGEVARELAETPDSESPGLRPLFRIQDQELTDLLVRLRLEASQEALGKDLMTSSLLTLIAGRIHRVSQAEQPAAGPVATSGKFAGADRARCIQLLNDRLHERISLSELAGEFDLSPYHFSRLFKEATGFPPHEYQLQLRIARARVLLRRSPEKNLAHIACELGFSDESHFRRHFKRIVGMTPGRFRSQQ